MSNIVIVGYIIANFLFYNSIFNEYSSIVLFIISNILYIFELLFWIKVFEFNIKLNCNNKTNNEENLDENKKERDKFLLKIIFMIGIIGTGISRVLLYSSPYFNDLLNQETILVYMIGIFRLINIFSSIMYIFYAFDTKKILIKLIAFFNVLVSVLIWLDFDNNISAILRISIGCLYYMYEQKNKRKEINLKDKIKILFFLLITMNISCSLNQDQKIENNLGSVKINKTYHAKGQDSRQKYIILHYTAANKINSLKILTEKNVSSHYLISDIETDPIYSLVDENKNAWHAGISSWKGKTNLNEVSIGIEIVNMGNSNGDYENFKEHQIKKIAILLSYLVNKYNIDPKGILAHSDIAPNRKSDPGPMFPWEILYKEYNLGVWYDEDVKIKYETMLKDEMKYSIIDIQNELKKFGYSVELTGILDTQTKNIIKAFQYRFRPKKYDGLMDNETYSILKALNDKYKN